MRSGTRSPRVVCAERNDGGGVEAPKESTCSLLDRSDFRWPLHISGHIALLLSSTIYALLDILLLSAQTIGGKFRIIFQHVSDKSRSEEPRAAEGAAEG